MRIWPKVDQLPADLYPTEICNALMKLERSGKIGAGDAFAFFGDYLQDLPALYDVLPRALEISQQFRQSVYDCLYIARNERAANL